MCTIQGRVGQGEQSRQVRDVRSYFNEEIQGTHMVARGILIMCQSMGPYLCGREEGGRLQGRVNFQTGAHLVCQGLSQIKLPILVLIAGASVIHRISSWLNS